MKKLFSNNTFLITAVYLLIILFLQVINGWYQNFSDAVHYLEIADRYSEADWPNAINTYWGPMISWLLLILKPIIAEPFVRFRILQILLGAIALFFINRILVKKKAEKKNALLFSLVSAPLIACFAWFYLTPDLLLTDAILLLLLFYSDERKPTFQNALKAALIGAALFFIKTVGLYFFVFVLVGRFIFEKKQWNWRSLMHHCIIAVFLLIFSAPWVYLISDKYGSFTLGTGAVHNYKMNSPRVTPDIYGELGNPHHNGQLVEPQPPGSFDAWMEPLQEPYMSWEGYSTDEIITVYKQILIKNLKSARSMYFGLDIGSIFALLFVAACILQRKKIRAYIAHHGSFLVVFLVNVLLYLPFFFMDRYTWPGLIALFLASVVLVNEMKPFTHRAVIFSIAVAFLGLNAFAIYKEISYSLPERPIDEAIWNTKQKTEMKRSVWLCSKNDKRLGLVKGLIYYNKGQYLGALFYDVYTRDEIAFQLSSFNINTIITFDGSADSLAGSLSTKNIYNTPPLKLYHYFKEDPRSKKKVNDVPEN